MYDPKFRFALLISIIVVVVTAIQVVYTYVMGERGLNITQYLSGTGAITAAVIGGFVFVWVSTKFITLERTHKKTGFEAGFVDETGTQFNFPVSLSKFMPDIVAPPAGRNLHPLEVELIGFLNGYRSWPFDITGAVNKSLYQHAMSQWRAMCTIDTAGPLHRAAALAQDLSKVYTYQETRNRYPWWQFWRRDQVRYKRRCMDHGGLSAFVVSTMPAFRNKLGKDEETNQRYRRALLTAIRYRDNPTSIPANCDPLAREIFEALHRAAQIAELSPGENLTVDPSTEEVQALNKQMQAYFQATVRDMELNPADVTARNDGVYLGNGKVVVRMSRLMKRYAAVLAPNVRSAFNMWEFDDTPQPAWPYLLDGLRAMGVLLDTWEDVPGREGMFSLSVNGLRLPHAIFIDVDQGTYPQLRHHLDSLPKWTGLLELAQNKESLREEVGRKAAAVDRMLKDMYQDADAR